MAIEEFENRLIGFFDVLGFSNLLEQRQILDLHGEYAALIDEANQHVFEQQAIAGSPEPHVSNFQKSQFLFDSLVVVSYPTNDVKNICKFVLSCLLLMEKAFVRGFFLRGCISLGDFLDDADRNIFLSSQFPRLVHAEKSQEWLGCYVDDIAEDVVLNGIFGLESLRLKALGQTRYMPLIEYNVPTKDGNDIARWCLNWVAMIDSPLFRSNLPSLVSPKRENTECFLNHVLALNDDSKLLPPDALPAIKASVMKTRGSARLKFFDKNGCGVKPGWQSWTMAAFEQ